MSLLRSILLLVPGGLTVYLAFNSGGYFAGATSLAALVLALVLLLRLVAADEPLAGLSGPLAITAGALMLFGAWTLLSSFWSDSPARALLELNRVLLYLFALLAFGLLGAGVAGVRRVLGGIALAFTAVAVVGFLTRTLPDVFEIAPAVQNERLSYPIGYWNALGLTAALGAVLCLHLTSSTHEPLWARVLGAAALPVLAATLLLTFSRGPLAAVVVGVVAYVLVARPRGLPGGLLAAGVPTALAVVAAYRADLLASKEPATAAAAAQGHDVALVVLLCTLVAAVLRRAMLGLDVRLASMQLTTGARRRLAAGAAALLVIGGAVALTATDLSARADTQLDRFTRSDLGQTGDNRDRLFDPGINRFDHWEIALDSFERHPLRGSGAGTYALLWDSGRPTDSDSEEAHSLYLEVLGELGLIGLLLLALALASLLIGVAVRARGRSRPLYGAVLAAGLTWAFNAGIDWDWEVAAVTLWLFALGGAALARAPEPGSPRAMSNWPLRAGMAVILLVLAATPALVAASQARLAQSVRAYEAGDCTEATDEALASIDALSVRPEPYEVIGFCDARLGQVGREPAIAEAVERDPDNWEYRYGLALVLASAGRDPRPAARAALRLNPREQRAARAVEAFATSDPRAWRRAASRIGLAIR